MLYSHSSINHIPFWHRLMPAGMCFLFLILSACSGGGSNAGSTTSAGSQTTDTASFAASFFGVCDSGAEYEVPCDFPVPKEQENNPVTSVKVKLGRFLFYDRNLSFNQTQSCADCHQQDKAFADALTVSVGSAGDLHPRNAMSLTNVVYNSTMNWANNQIVNLDQQALAVLLNEEPVELGWSGHETEILERIAGITSNPDYPALFAATFPESADQISIGNVTKALAAFGAIMISGDSEFDKAQRGEPNSFSDAARRGRDLFFGERLECFHCHSGFNFSDSVDHSGIKFTQASFHNNGLYNLDGKGLYPADNHGLREFTLQAADEGKFRAPSLRNIALTAPYMHDGSIATLDEVIDHYARGGRLITTGPNAGDGALNPNKSSLINGFLITADERLDLIAFLESLTDWKFICRDDLSDPFGNIPKHPLCP